MKLSWTHKTLVLRALMKLLCALVLIGLGAPATGQKLPTPQVFQLGAYPYAIPVWWNKVQVKLPEHFQSMLEVQAYVFGKYGSDVGTTATWKMALKTYALAYQRFPRELPVYIAHCYMRGGEVGTAAKIYAELYELSPTQAGEEHWYRVYLAFNAGLAYAKWGRSSDAKHWYSRAASYVSYTGPLQGEITGYALWAEQALGDSDLLPYHEK